MTFELDGRDQKQERVLVLALLASLGLLAAALRTYLLGRTSPLQRPIQAIACRQRRKRHRSYSKFVNTPSVTDTTSHHIPLLLSDCDRNVTSLPGPARFPLRRVVPSERALRSTWRQEKPNFPASLTKHSAVARPMGGNEFISADVTTTRQPRPVRGVIFDVDGTLADSFRLGFEATQQVLTVEGHARITEHDYHEGTRYPTPERLARHIGLSPGDEGFEEIGERLGASFDSLYIGLVNEATAGFYEDVGPLLNNIAACASLGALTNAAVAYAEAVLDVNEVRSSFLTVHGADDSPRPKPHPDGLIVCVKELGLDPSECVYIGDSPTDGKAARAAGCHSIGVSWGSHRASKLVGEFDIICHTVDELSTALAALVPGMDKSLPGHPLAHSLAATAATPGSGPQEMPTGPAQHAFLFDRDGVLNRDVGPPGVLQHEQIEMIPGAGKAVAEVRGAGHACRVVTNQKAIGDGFLDESSLDVINHCLRQQLAVEGGRFASIGPHSAATVLHADGRPASTYRLKPSPDLILAAAWDAGVPASRAIVIGDKLSDLEAASEAGAAAAVLVTSSPHGERAAARLLDRETGVPGSLANVPIAVVADAHAAVRWALDRLSAAAGFGKNGTLVHVDVNEDRLLGSAGGFFGDGRSSIGSYVDASSSAGQDASDAPLAAVASVAESLARKAASVVREELGAEVTATKASRGDLVTNVDKQVQKLIEAGVKSAFPDHGFLGEESVAAGAAASANALQEALGAGQSGVAVPKEGSFLWVIDPIDGTTNFVQGLPLCGISIGVARFQDGAWETVIGIIHDPFRDECFSAIQGQGAKLDGKSIMVGSEPASEAVVATGFAPNEASLRPMLRGMSAVGAEVRTIRMIGSAAIMLAWVACGRLSAYFEADLNSWDTAAGVLIIREAGGTVTGLDGVPHALATRSLLASNAASHARLQQLLASADVVGLDKMT